MNKTYACSDLHGMYGLWTQIKNYCDETDKIYFLGDACDRGPDGVAIIYELLRDERVTYLKGNHEDMLVICMSDILQGCHFDDLPWWIMNGGKPTFDVLQKASEQEQSNLINKIKKLPTSALYVNPSGQEIYMTHAGTDLNYTEDELIRYFGEKRSYLWDRQHFYAEHPKDLPKLIQVHGHTPVVSSSFTSGLNLEKEVKTIKYSNGHKYNIDMGAFGTNTVALLDLDTLETIYFKESEEKHHE